jgi:hypothetical protein
MIILKMTVQETAADELNRYSLPDLQILFQLIFPSSFRFLIADYRFSKFRYCKRKRFMDMKGAGKRERPADRI